MEKYSRYTDSKQRLFVLIERWAKPINENGAIRLKPTTITLLNVHAETTQVLTVSQFQEFIDKKSLIKIEKTA